MTEHLSTQQFVFREIQGGGTSLFHNDVLYGSVFQTRNKTWIYTLANDPSYRSSAFSHEEAAKMALINNADDCYRRNKHYLSIKVNPGQSVNEKCSTNTTSLKSANGGS